MTGLPHGEESTIIWYAVSTQYRKVTDGETDRDEQNCCINIARHRCCDDMPLCWRQTKMAVAITTGGYTDTKIYY